MQPLKKAALPVALAAVLSGAGPAPAEAAVNPAMERCVLQGINSERAQRGRQALAMRWPLRRAARARARSMADGGYFAHVSPAGIDAWSILSSYGRRVRDMAEAIGRNYGYTPTASCRWMVRWWMASPPHRDLLMKGSRRIIGVGVERRGNRSWLVALPAERQWRR
jgi:uncharacterized protein YkwD